MISFLIHISYQVNNIVIYIVYNVVSNTINYTDLVVYISINKILTMKLLDKLTNINL